MGRWNEICTATLPPRPNRVVDEAVEERSADLVTLNFAPSSPSSSLESLDHGEPQTASQARFSSFPSIRFSFHQESKNYCRQHSRWILFVGSDSNKYKWGSMAPPAIMINLTAPHQSNLTRVALRASNLPQVSRFNIQSWLRLIPLLRSNPTQPYLHLKDQFRAGESTPQSTLGSNTTGDHCQGLHESFFWKGFSLGQQRVSFYENASNFALHNPVMQNIQINQVRTPTRE